ncbi:outer membrane beta-barrel protein [Hoylesella buccalis]|uniref:outer membrane beta-barrel protein n=1 Tax=Hoylesella buccalis TaxID=28127 RepID=UPI00288A0E3C|nr:outer membrane beta-barrel protein [Hoylesella buccalis]
MRKLFLTAVIALLSIGAYAQKGQTYLGGQLAYPTEIESLGIGVKGGYGITDAIRAQATFDYFLKKNNVSWWDLNLDVHYLFPLGNNIKVYPLAGLTYLRGSVDGFTQTVNTPDGNITVGNNESYSDGNLGLNLGGGFQYDLTDKLVLNAEVKFQIIKNTNQGVISAGLAYKF